MKRLQDQFMQDILEHKMQKNVTKINEGFNLLIKLTISNLL